jgi:hypothetical protein
MGQEEVLRDAFTRARDYKATWEDYRRAGAKGVAPRRDLELEPLVEVLDGKRLVHAHGYRGDEMLMLLNVADEFGFKVKTLQHGLEGYKIASEIAKHGAGLSSFADSWSYKIEAYDAIPYNVAILMRKGVLTTINSDSDERVRRLNVDAAKLMRYGGLTEEEALKTITYNGAEQLGVQDRSGRSRSARTPTSRSGTRTRSASTRTSRRPSSTARSSSTARRTSPQREAKARERADLEKAEANQAPTPASASRSSPTRSAADAAPSSLAGALAAALVAARAAGRAAGLLQPAAGAAGHLRDPRARVVTVSGPELASGTVVISGGRIAAVGADARCPRRHGDRRRRAHGVPRHDGRGHVDRPLRDLAGRRGDRRHQRGRHVQPERAGVLRRQPAELPHRRHARGRHHPRALAARRAA